MFFQDYSDQEDDSHKQSIFTPTLSSLYIDYGITIPGSRLLDWFKPSDFQIPTQISSGSYNDVSI